MSRSDQVRIYTRTESVVFLKTGEPWGGLSNMAGGYPIRVNGIRILTSEALYQACRFPHLPDVQRMIIGESSPMTAKMKSKPHRKDSRPDWDRVRINVMRWCLRMKLAQNWASFSELLLRTDDRPIVEESRRDDFWGAKPVDDRTLVGMNVLGRLLMELRDAVKSHGGDAFLTLEPPDIPGFLLVGLPIGAVVGPTLGAHTLVKASTGLPVDHARIEQSANQRSLFNTFYSPATREEPAPANKSSPTPEDTPLGDRKPYPEMKDTGVLWLGEVPEHWEVRKLRQVLTRHTERNRPDLPLLSVVREQGVILRDRTRDDENHNYIPDDLSNYKVVRSGQFAINKMKAWQGSYGVSRYDGIVSPAYFVFDLSDVSGSFFSRSIRSRAYVPAFTQASEGVRIGQWDLSESRMREISFVVPPLPEQAAIVRFLDYVDRRIRRYIRAKQKLIKLLEEQKQAIIHHAVTRGLDPNVRLKPSGVEWLGDVPEHWEVASLRHRYSQVLGKMLDSKRITGQCLLPYLRNTDVQWDRINVDGLPKMDIGSAEYERYTVRAGDLLVCEGGEVGRAAIWTSKLPLCGFQKALHRLRPLNPERDVPRFLYFALRAATKGNAFSDGHVSTIAHLTGEKLRGHPFPFPPSDEQRTIAQWLDVELVQIENAVDCAARQIKLLREYRTRLIADVVTGKLDVREAAARLPDESDESEPLDESVVESDAQEAGAADTEKVPEEAEA